MWRVITILMAALTSDVLAIVGEIQALKGMALKGSDVASDVTLAQFKAVIAPYMCGMAREEPDVCISACQAMFSDNSVPILSIGSGLGLFEGFLTRIGLPVVCIDPAPYSFNRSAPTGEAAQFITMPAYGTVNDYCAECVDAQSVPQSAHGNINMLINWPWPGDDAREPYDYDAIARLKPVGFVVMYGPCGAAGSEELIEALTGRDGLTTFLKGAAVSRQVCTFGDTAYRLVMSADKVHGTGYGFTGKTIRCARYARI